MRLHGIYGNLLKALGILQADVDIAHLRAGEPKETEERKAKKNDLDIY